MRQIHIRYNRESAGCRREYLRTADLPSYVVHLCVSPDGNGAQVSAKPDRGDFHILKREVVCTHVPHDTSKAVLKKHTHTVIEGERERILVR